MSNSERAYTTPAVLTEQQLEIVSAGGFNPPSCGTPLPVHGSGGLGNPGSPNVPCGTHPPHLTFS
jgi:hypothetical protein